MLTDLQRYNQENDLNCQKFMAIFTGTLGLVTGLMSIATYAHG